MSKGHRYIPPSQCPTIVYFMVPNIIPYKMKCWHGITLAIGNLISESPILKPIILLHMTISLIMHWHVYF